MVRTNRRSGFTLVDLIVCVVLALVFLCIFIPYVANSRQKAREMNVSFQIFQTERSISIVEDELKELDAMEHALSDPQNEFYRVCEEKGELENTRQAIHFRQREFRQELARLKVELSKWKEREAEGNPFPNNRHAVPVTYWQ